MTLITEVADRPLHKPYAKGTGLSRGGQNHFSMVASWTDDVQSSRGRLADPSRMPEVTSEVIPPLTALSIVSV